MKLADSAGKLKTIGLGDMLMLWDGNVMYVLFEYLSDSVAHFCCPLKGILGMLTEWPRLLQASRLGIFVMLVFVTM